MRRASIDDPRWVGFVESHPQAGPFHHPAWSRVLANSYGLKPFALVREDGAGDIAAGLPMMEVDWLLAKRRWVCLPFTDRCPPLAAPGGDERLAEALEAVRVKEGLARIEIRAPVAGDVGHQDEVAVIHDLNLTGGLEAVRAGFHASQVRRNIVRAERERVTVRRGERESDLIEVVYGLHLMTRRRHGAPIQPRRFFRLLWRHVLEPGLGFVLIASVDDRPIAAAVFLAWNGTLVYKFGASDADNWRLRPNHAIFWDAIRWAVESGFRRIDFGRTDTWNRGLREFKGTWGATETPLVYTTFGAKTPRASHGRGRKVLEPVIRRSPYWVCRGIGELLYKYTA